MEYTDYIMDYKDNVEFEKRITALYGKPNFINQNGIRICTWTNGNSKAISELNESLNNSYIHWIIE